MHMQPLHDQDNKQDNKNKDKKIIAKQGKRSIMNVFDRMMNQAKQSKAAVKAQRDPQTFTLQAQAIEKRSKSAGDGESIPLSIPKPLLNNTQVILYFTRC